MPIDPVTAVGLVGNIVQLIDSGTKLVSKAREIHTSATGATRDVADLNHVTEELSRLSKVLQDGLAGADSGDSELENLCRACIETADKLTGALHELTAKGPLSKWKSVRQALKTVWKKEEIESMKESLNGYRAQLNLHVVVNLRRDVMKLNLRQSEQFKTLDQTAQRQTEEIINALACQDEFFKACLQTHSQRMRDKHEEVTRTLTREHAKTREHINQSRDETKTHILLTANASNAQLQQAISDQVTVARTSLEHTIATGSEGIRNAVVANGGENRELILRSVHAAGEQIQTTMKLHIEHRIATLQQDLRAERRQRRRPPPASFFCAVMLWLLPEGHSCLVAGSFLRLVAACVRLTITIVLYEDTAYSYGICSIPWICSILWWGLRLHLLLSLLFRNNDNEEPEADALFQVTFELVSQRQWQLHLVSGKFKSDLLLQKAVFAGRSARLSMCRPCNPPDQPNHEVTMSSRPHKHYLCAGYDSLTQLRQQAHKVCNFRVQILKLNSFT